MSDTSFLSLAGILLATGFTVGFGHCIGMCGPIMVSLALHLGDRNRIPAHLLYHAGRLVTYAVLGAAMGLTGSFTDLASRIAGVQRAVQIGTGVVIILMGLAMAGWLPRIRIFQDDDACGGWFSSLLRKWSCSKGAAHLFPLGLALGLLPCGPVYTALLTVVRGTMAAPSPAIAAAGGAGLMFAFGLGTVPALLLIGRLSRPVGIKQRRIIYRIGALLTVAVGIWFAVLGVKG
jgi:sulfite exporter TauE/SafE